MGAKLIYKRPPQRAAEGKKWFLKLYFGGNQIVSNHKIKSAIQFNSNAKFHSTVFNSMIPLHSEFFIAKNANMTGQVLIDMSKVQIKNHKNFFKYYDVTYKDLNFMIFEEVNSADFCNRYIECILNNVTAILKEKSKVTQIFLSENYELLKNKIVHYLTKEKKYFFKKN